ncbi:PQQ-binding-like beta-propeller repeat protein [Persicobacter psychrovividus]|uniref:Pyrrolo-quinoline quinone repeat domain-containing protein n=1 Tax=Persicobacter psychrovividus TaxID=387638 RepID=A0ABM7VCT8_9BACT|nr:hypothetical protein PEPS_10300 [Persicobacter psychrovividus]
MSRQSIFLFFFFLIVNQSFADNKDHFIKSGDPELDAVRQEVVQAPTDRGNFKFRAIKMKLWAAMLQQQGVPLPEYVAVDNALNKVTRWNNLRFGGEPQQFSASQVAELSDIIGRGYQVLEKYQKQASTQPSLAFTSSEQPIDAATQKEIPWTSYKGNKNLSGYTGANGPTKGEMAWKFPVGLAWEVQPQIEGDRVYLSSPGVRTNMFCVDLKTGEEHWKTQQIIEIMGDQLYHAPNNQSTPVVLKDKILFRELGARGNSGPTKEIVVVDKITGKIEREILAGHVDYRAGNAPFDADEDLVVYTFGIQDIHDTPPKTQAANRVIGKNIKTGKVMWDYMVGYTFAEPVLHQKRVYVGTQDGYMYSWDATKRQFYRPKPQWQFRAGGPINKQPLVLNDRLIFGANDGKVYCLNNKTGALIWEFQAEDVQEHAFSHFTTPFVSDNKVFIGAANGHLYGLDLESGKEIMDFKADDWIKSAPVAKGNQVFFATLKGTLYGVEIKKGKVKTLFEKHIAHHPILADLAIKDDIILVNDTDLYAHAISTKGKTLWKKSLIESFEKDGNRILTDQIAGGAYYQSKPTASNNTIYFGTPMRFVFAVDSETGKEKWKFELGASISGAPTIYKDKIYVGQQGGEDEFYCLDAKTGDLIWSQKVDWVWGSATVSDGMVYVPGIDGYAWALDANNGQIVWRQPFSKSVCSEPAVDDERVYFGCWDDYLKAFDKKTGEIIWQFNGAGTDSGVAIVKDGKIFVKNKCIDAKTGELLWEFKDGNNIFNITPAVHDGKVYMSCWHGLGLGGVCVEAVVYCIDIDSGNLLWTQNGAGLSSPVIGGEGDVYFPSIADPYFYCVDANGNGDGTTKVKWMYQMGNKVEESTPALYKGKAYVMSSDGYMHAIQ